MAENVEELQALKAAVHFTTGRLCESVGADMGVTFNKQVIATLAELTNKQIQTYTSDLEAFAKHARRKYITPDDVKLLVRRNPKLAEHIEILSQTLEEGSSKTTGKKRGRKPKSSANLSEAGASAIVDCITIGDDSN